MSDVKFNRRMARAQASRLKYNQRQEIKAARRPPVKHARIQTSKKFMYFMVVNCSVIELYSMIVMLVLGDLSALYALIGAVVGEVVSLSAYFAKSYNETKQEEIIKLEREKLHEHIIEEDDPEA